MVTVKCSEVISSGKRIFGDFFVAFFENGLKE